MKGKEMGAKNLSGCDHKFNEREVLCSNCGDPNPLFRKSIAAAKNYMALIPRNIHDLISVIFTLLIVFGVCGATKAIFYGTPYHFLLLSFAAVGAVGLIAMLMSNRGNHEQVERID